MEENLEQAHDARLMDFEAGIADGTDSDRVGKALEEGKVPANPPRRPHHL